jgi:hypothetical protein
MTLGSDTIAGTVQGYIIQVDRIINDGESLFDACDAHSQTLHDYGCVLFDVRSGESRRATEDQFGVVSTGDILIWIRSTCYPHIAGVGSDSLRLVLF